MGSSGGNAETALALSAVAATGGKYFELLFQTTSLPAHVSMYFSHIKNVLSLQNHASLWKQCNVWLLHLRFSFGFIDDAFMRQS